MRPSRVHGGHRGTVTSILKILSRLIHAGVLLLLALLVGLQSLGEGAPPPLAGKLIYLQGSVEVRRSDAQIWEAAQVNQDLYAGDAIRTRALSRAAILCVDESQIKLNENTHFVLAQVTPSPRLQLGGLRSTALSELSRSLYKILQGEIWLRNKNEKILFDVETPVANGGIRGTEFNLRVGADGTSDFIMLEGRLCLSNSYGDLMLAAGEAGLVRPGQAPTKRVLVQPADAVQWCLYYPGIISYRDLPLIAGGSETRPSPQPQGIASLISQGETAYDQGHLDRAREQAEAALKLAPQSSRALTLMGWISLQNNAPEEAQGYFRRVSEPDDRALVGLALAHYRLGDASGAYKLIKDRPPGVAATPLLEVMTGYFALLAGKVDEAKAILEAAAHSGKMESLALSLLAQIYLVQNHKDAAKNEAGRALAQNPGSPLAQLTMALVNIAYFDPPAARLHLEKALAADPRFIDAYIYLAKIWLGGDYLDRAWRTVEQALRLAPREGEVLALAGFIRLGYRDYAGALKFFTRAVEAAPALGEPHLGLGTYYFRYRDFPRGLTEMLTATLLEPRISLYQSELGKALYQVRSFDKALEVYDYAKTLDPKDPTPYLYKGIALTDLYRPGEAIQEINRSIELNDNRALFRSRIMLDRDLAVRNYDLAQAYDQLALNEWALSKAVTAVKNDPTSSLAHHFLSQAYLFNRTLAVGASASEYLLYQLLSPANQNTFSIYNDYTPMFEMPFVRAQVATSIGTWEEGGGNFENPSASVYGGVPGAAFQVKGSYSDDRGFRPHNGDDTFYDIFAFAKWDPTVKDSLFANFDYADDRSGDTFNLNDYSYKNDRALRNFTHLRDYQVGYVHRFTPQWLTLSFLDYRATDNSSLKDFILAKSGPFRIEELIRTLTPEESTSVQMQNQLILGNHTLMAGFDYLSGHTESRYQDKRVLRFLKNPVDFSEFKLDFQPPNRASSLYLLDYWRPTSRLVVEGGLFREYGKNSRYFSAEPIYSALWSGQFGINYQVNAQHTLRLGLMRHLSSFSTTPTLTPTDVASFVWRLDTLAGARLKQAGGAWEAQWDAKTFSALRVEALQVDTPFEGFWDDWKRYQGSFTVNRILTPAWGLTLGVTGKKFQENMLVGDFSEVNALSRLWFQYPSGWLGGVRCKLLHQDLKNRSDDTFPLVNLGFGKLFDNKRGFFLFTVENLFNRHFYYQLEPIALDMDFPVRRYTFAVGLNF